MALLIKDSAQKIRANRPTARGMHPAIEERLRRLGIDPDMRARSIALAAGTSGAAPRLPTSPVAAQARDKVLALSLDPGDVRVRPLLNRAALMYRNEAFVADDVCPVELVDERSAQYQIWGRDDDLETPDPEIGPEGSAKEVNPTLSDDNYSVRDFALKGAVKRDTELANPTLGLRARVSANVKNRLSLWREMAVSGVFLNTSNYSGDNLIALGSGFNWNGGVSADPVADMLDATEAVQGVDITDMVMSDLVWHAVVQNDDLKAILASQIDNQGILREGVFAGYFGVKRLRVSKANKKTSAGRVRIWGTSSIWMGYVDPSPGQLTFARTFRLRQGAGGYVTKIIPKEDAGINGVEYVRVAHSDDPCKIVAPTYGVLVTGVRQ